MSEENTSNLSTWSDIYEIRYYPKMRKRKGKVEIFHKNGDKSLCEDINHLRIANVCIQRSQDFGKGANYQFIYRFSDLVEGKLEDKTFVIEG